MFYNLEYGQINTNKGSNNKTKPSLAHTNGATRKTDKQAKLNISMDRAFDCLEATNVNIPIMKTRMLVKIQAVSKTRSAYEPMSALSKHILNRNQFILAEI